ncbi:MAG TPA: choice-of-anchor tandem repeat GloVer-containing protein, partial [Vicinamibacterales bacterium]|nr:choice-of-anchor tandem repeat GloVer-containing protein [Vicinamibacterales bacterium]
MLLSLPAMVVAQASFEVLHSFVGGTGDGANAFSGLIQGSDGFFYGTTQRGGAFNAGTVYRMTSSGTVTILHSFTGGADGGLPSTTLIQGDDGLLYGTALTNSKGFGAVFSVTTSGTVKVLHSFEGYPTDGAGPYASLVKGRDGNLYGATFNGGPSNAGTVYRLTPEGSFTILYAFKGMSDRAGPFAALVQAADDSFYGTTRTGAIYKVSPGGAFAVVHQMNAETEGETVDSALALGTDGNLYGTARGGGPTDRGTVFRVTPGGAVTVLHA